MNTCAGWICFSFFFDGERYVDRSFWQVSHSRWLLPKRQTLPPTFLKKHKTKKHATSTYVNKMRLCFRTLFNFPKNAEHSPWKMVGTWVSFWESSHFQGQTICQTPGVLLGVYLVWNSLPWRFGRQDDIIGVAFGQGNIPNLRWIGWGWLHGRVEEFRGWVEASELLGFLLSPMKFVLGSWYFSPAYWLVYIFGGESGGCLWWLYCPALAKKTTSHLFFFLATFKMQHGNLGGCFSFQQKFTHLKTNMAM